MQHQEDERRTRMMLKAAFGGIATLLLVSQILGYIRWSTTQGTVIAIQSNAIASVGLIARMSYDVQRERILVQRILDHAAPRIAAMEREIAALRDDYSAAAREYAPLITFEGEAIAWGELTRDVAIAERQAIVALQLSRADRSAEATAALVAAEPAFEAVSRGLKALIDINQDTVHRARSRTAEVGSNALQVRILLAAVIVLITLGVGRRLTRIVSSNERKLKQQTIELQNKNQELDAFAGRVAHELLGPLNNIGLVAEVLTDDGPSDPAAVGVLQRGVTRMNSLVHDLLSLSRAGGLAKDAVTRPDVIAASVAADILLLVSDAGGALRVDVEPAVIRCSDGLLQEALWNLAENAVKYCRPDVPPAIAFVGRTTSAGYELRVSDNGLGMSADDARRAFEPFFRGKQTHAIRGTGLGLAIVRRIVEASGGAVFADSQVDHGTTITLRFLVVPTPAVNSQPTSSVAHGCDSPSHTP